MECCNELKEGLEPQSIYIWSIFFNILLLALWVGVDKTDDVYMFFSPYFVVLMNLKMGLQRKLKMGILKNLKIEVLRCDDCEEVALDVALRIESLKF